MYKIEVGTFHSMTVTGKTEESYTLTKQRATVTLAVENATRELALDEEVDVFVYHDKLHNLLATMNFPEVTTGSYGWAEVIQIVPSLGAFVNFGLDREFLVPHDTLPAYRSVWPKHGDKLYVTLTHDKQGRLLARLASEESFDDVYEYGGEQPVNTEVRGYTIRVDREGAVILTDENFRGFIHHTEVAREPRLGEYVFGRVIEAKEDGSINVSLLPLKHERIDTDAEKILAYLNESAGEMNFTDKSDPGQIKTVFQMSKSSFKRALGNLMKKRLINQKDRKTFLVKDNEQA